MQVCGSCFKAYDDGHFSNGGICDYCFAMLGLAHTYDFGTIHVDLTQKRYLSTVRPFDPVGIQSVYGKGIKLNYVELYRQVHVRGLQADAREEDEGANVSRFGDFSDALQFGVPKPMLRYGF